ncbi:MAG: hypothetical protein RXO29_04310 [Desulfurococcales archaeon]|uniref:Transcription elongation factor n=1 Tax=Fervidicoccus fontis TaxID=683846 RepID=A0A7J3SKA8_9CREN
MGRRRKKREQPKRIVRKIPKIFMCPHCSKQTLRISVSSKPSDEYAVAEAFCGECGFCARFKVPKLYQPVDAYGKLVDLYDSFTGKIEEEIRNKRCIGDLNSSKEEISENEGK